MVAPASRCEQKALLFPEAYSYTCGLSTADANDCFLQLLLSYRHRARTQKICSDAEPHVIFSCQKNLCFFGKSTSADIKSNLIRISCEISHKYSLWPPLQREKNPNSSLFRGSGSVGLCSGLPTTFTGPVPSTGPPHAQRQGPSEDPRL